MSDRHVEIMRDDLSEIYYDAARNDIEYLFGNEITAISADGDVTFARTSPRRYDIVIGADGLHSGVRRLVFGDVEAGQTDFLGAYLSVVSLPKTLARDGESTGFVDADRCALIYTTDHLDDARALFCLSPRHPSSTTIATSPSRRRCYTTGSPAWRRRSTGGSTNSTAHPLSTSTRSPNCG